MGFSRLVALLLCGLCEGLPVEVDRFFGRLADSASFCRGVCADTVRMARKKLAVSCFTDLNEALLASVAGIFAHGRWHGLRIVACDSTTLRLPLSCPTTRETYGLHTAQAGDPYSLARASGLFAVASGLMLRAVIGPSKVAERDQLVELLGHLAADDLLVLDRGYPAYWLFALLQQGQRHFCMRIETSWPAVQTFLRSGQSDAVVTMKPGNVHRAEFAARGVPLAPLRLRLVRVILPTGQIEVLVTSLLDQAAYPVADFAALYHSRWRIEEAFKLLKARILVEHFSGETPLAIEQDFHAKILTANLCALAAFDASQLLPVAKASTHTVNLTYTLKALRAVMPRMLLGLAQDAEFHQLIQLLASNLHRKRPERSHPRKPKIAKPRRYRAYK